MCNRLFLDCFSTYPWSIQYVRRQVIDSAYWKKLFSSAIPVILRLIWCLSVGVKPWPNDRNMPAQHIATLLGATRCLRLTTVLRHVARCWVLLAQIWPFSNLSQQHPTYRNTSQHGGQTHATRCAQQCCDMLRWHVAIVWPGLNAILSCISNWPSEVISVIPFQPAMFWSVPSSETLQISNKD